MMLDHKGKAKRRPAHRASGTLSRNKRISPASIALLILTPVCIIASILLPNVVSSYQHDQMLDNMQYYTIPVDEIAAAAEAPALSSDLRGKEAVMRAFQVLSGDHYLVSSSEGFRMKRRQVLDVITGALEDFSQNGFGVQPDKLELDKINQEFAILNDGSAMIRIWECSYRYKDEAKGALSLIVDDASEKIVLYDLDSYVSSDFVDSDHSNDKNVIAKWAKIWSGYLGIEFDNISIEDEMAKVASSFSESGDESSDASVPLEVSASLLIDKSKIFLNIYWIEERETNVDGMRLILNMSPQAESFDDMATEEIDSPNVSDYEDIASE